MGFNAPAVTTIVVTTSAVTFNLVEPTAQGQQQAGQCGGDVSGDYKFTVNLGDGTTVVPTDTFCKSKADGTKVPFDSRRQAYIDHATSTSASCPVRADSVSAVLSHHTGGSLTLSRLPAGRVTMATIAEAAGVSVPTVSRVLNGDDQVATATRARIERLLGEYGYRARNARPPVPAGLIHRRRQLAGCAHRHRTSHRARPPAHRDDHGFKRWTAVQPCPARRLSGSPRGGGDGRRPQPDQARRIRVRVGIAAAQQLLDHPDPPTAIFAFSDYIALGVYEAARVRGLSIPEQLSVVGFDDLPAAGWASPPLTTVRQPLEDMGRLAARKVLNLARRKAPESPRMELDTRLAERGSTAPPSHSRRH